MAGKTKDTLTVVVAGHEVEVKANENQEVSTIVKEALRLSSQGRPAEDWVLRAGSTEGAQVIEPTRKLRDYSLGLSSVLYLNLGTGGGGAR